MKNLKLKILSELLSHLEDGDAGDLRDLLKPKPKAVGIEVSEIGLKPKDPLMEKADEMEPEKGPMEKLLGGAKSKEDMEEELSDDELEELIKEHLS